MTGSWVYVGGADDGSRMKIGRTAQASPVSRVSQLDGGEREYVLLAAVRTTDPAGVEKVLHRSFQRLGTGRKREYFTPDDNLVEYVLWLRAQHFTMTDPTDNPDNYRPVLVDDVDPGDAARRHSRPVTSDDELFGTYQATGPLRGTWWDWMPDPLATFKDYFTPPELVGAASDAMGGIDIDAASHLIAHRRLRQAGVHIDDYYTVNRSGLEHPWKGNVWLNPPYGYNEPWIDKATLELDEGRCRQLCWLSPAHVFGTKQMQPLVRRASAMVLLTPTPQFYNPGNPTMTGTNLPHLIVYWGDRPHTFHAAYAEHLGMRLVSDN